MTLALIEPGLYPDIPDEEYHADNTALSSSGARTIVFESPADYRHTPRVDKAEYDFGHAAHLYVLGKGAQIRIVEADDWRTDKAKAKRAELRAAGLVPLLPKEDQQARDMAAVALEHELAGALFAVGEAELSGWWIDPETGARCRFRLDWITRLPDGRLVIVDYKTSKGAGRAAFAKSVGEYGYFAQQPFYVDGAAALGVHVDDFLFVSQCKTYPYRVTVGRVDPLDVDLGRRINRQAIRTFAECMAADHWPDNSGEIYAASIPAYTRYRAEELLAS
ncbi:PD-(D/E)XK nuclease-like domain-containing protein [Nocardia sp. NPDC055049]